MKRNHWNSHFKVKAQKPLKKSVLRKLGKSPASVIKREIQRLLREICLKRDKGCILRSVRCGAVLGDRGVVWQADHLLSRSNAATYGDPRLVTLVCKSCHAWKSLGSNLRKSEYDRLVRSILLPERVKLWDLAEIEAGRYKGVKVDWLLTELALKKELELLS